jgi:hypothetical protein
MLELKIFTYFLIAVVVILPLYFIGATLYKRKRDIENETKKKVYVTTLVLTYCGVGTDLMNKHRLTYRDYTKQEAGISYKKLQTIGTQVYQKLDTISDDDLFNFADVIFIRKKQFIAIEIGWHHEYE